MTKARNQQMSCIECGEKFDICEGYMSGNTVICPNCGRSNYVDEMDGYEGLTVKPLEDNELYMEDYLSDDLEMTIEKYPESGIRVGKSKSKRELYASVKKLGKKKKYVAKTIEQDTTNQD